MKQSIGYVAVVVADYDETIAFYVETLGFDLIEDTFIEAQNNRWGLVAPPGSTETKVLLARAVGAEQPSRVGNQTGGRVFCFFTRTTFGAISTRTSAKTWSLCASLARRATARSSCSEISAAICGTCWNSSISFWRRRV